LRINKHVIDELLLEFRTPEQILGKDGLIKQLTKAVLERALDAELAHHLRDDPAPTASPGGLEAPQGIPEPARRNVRNGHSRKTVRSEHGQLTLDIPRDREASFEPVLVPKHQRRLAGVLSSPFLGYPSNRPWLRRLDARADPGAGAPSWPAVHAQSVALGTHCLALG
jgi:hypothetical protein